MTIKEFDRIATAIVYYNVYNDDDYLLDWLTRDVSHSPDLYRRNMVKLVKYGDAKITHVYCANDVIHVTAVIDQKEQP